jgi:tetratricopeptide (TPR) repeat protein
VRRALLGGALLLVASACSNAPPASADESYRRGLAALEAHDPKTARVDLLNAIKARPGDPRLHLAQARTFLLLGDGDGAQAEIARARQLGAPAAATRHLMAHALLLQGQNEAAIAEAKHAAPAFAAYASRIRGSAALAAGDEEGAAAAFAEAVAAGPNDSLVWSDVARFRRSTGDLAGAIAAADKAVALDPENREALSLRGELTRSQYGLAASVAWFDRALEVDPDYAPARLERAATLLDLGRTLEMLADARQVLKASPDNPRAWFLEAILAARASKFDLARRLYSRTDGAFDDEPAAMLLTGAIELRTGHAELAAGRLRRLVEAQPDNAKARRLLATSLWQSGDARGTADALRPLADRADADAYTLTLAGQAYRKLGDVPRASAYLARAAMPQQRSTSALLYDPLDDESFVALRNQAEARPGDAGVQVPFIRALLGRGLGSEALERARQLEAGNSGAPDAHVLVGDALGIQGDFAGAAEAYRRAANIAFTEPVAMRLIEALRNAGDARAAAQVLSLFLAQNPQSVPAQMLAANALLQAKRWPAAIVLFERLRTRLGDRDATLLNNLAWAYSQTGEYERALPMARKAWSLDKDNPATADTLGWLLFKSGRDRAQGLFLLQQAARGAPSDAQIRSHLSAVGAGRSG